MAEDKKKGIPSSKVQRAARFARTGAKVGGNYIRHYGKKLVTGKGDREALDQKNASDIYDTLSDLKGSALKVAQMMSMNANNGVIPSAYLETFAQAQYQAPALSGPLVVKTFRKAFGKPPSEVYDHFETTAVHAASIGQVHRAEKDGQPLAVKIQYPGVANSISSDLRLVRPVARTMFGWKDRDLDVYFNEVEARLLEEADYEHELEFGQRIAEACVELPNLIFPTYYPELSNQRILTMSWVDGLHLDAYLATDPDQAERDLVGQTLWDFYNYQTHQMRLMHADAHPGNFLFFSGGKVGVLDFGCIKQLPEDFYHSYVEMLQPGIVNDEPAFVAAATRAELLLEGDSEEERTFFLDVLRETLTLLGRPFHHDRFDFSDTEYFDEIYEYGERMARDPKLRQTQAPRGSADGIYLNRAYFGLFMILHKLGARIDTRRFIPDFNTLR